MWSHGLFKHPATLPQAPRGHQGDAPVHDHGKELDQQHESVLDVIARVTEALQRQCAEQSGGIILMVTHGDPALILRGAFLGIAPEKIRSEVPYFDNCDVVELVE